MSKIQNIQPAILNLNLSSEAIAILYYNFSNEIHARSRERIRGVSEFNKDE